MTLLTARKTLTPRQKQRRINRRARRDANQVVNIGNKLGEKIAPELYTEEGLGRLDANKYTGFIDEGKSAFNDILSQFESVNADTMARRKDGLEGLNSAENTALRERAFSGVDRGRQQAMSELLAQQSGAGLGGGANFAQQRAVARDFDTQRGQLEQGLLLENVGIKNKALADYEQANQNAFANRTGIQGQLTGLDQTGAGIQQQIDDFNLSQLQKEIASKTAIMNTGASIFSDSKNQILADQKLQQMLDFIREQEANKYAQIQGIL